MRVLAPILCLLLAVTAVGRFRAEAAHRAVAHDLSGLRSDRADAELSEHRLKLEVEVLESASRLGDVNGRTVRLSPARPDQLKSQSDFAGSIGREAVRQGASDRSDVIGNAILMADPAAPVPSGAAAKGRGR